MSTAFPLTASSDIQRGDRFSLFNQNNTTSKQEKTLFGVYTDDIVEISKLGLEKQQKAKQIETSKEIDDIANEVIRISSTIGKSRSAGSLTQSQAVKLYNKIASLL